MEPSPQDEAAEPAKLSAQEDATPAAAAQRDDSPDAIRVRLLDQELAAARDEIEALHQMLEDLPEIFERKFRQRLEPILEHQQRLIAENQSLHERFLALGPAVPPERPQLPPAREQPRAGWAERLVTLLRRKGTP